MVNVKNAVKFNEEEFSKLKIGDKVWYYNSLVTPIWNEENLDEGFIVDIVRVAKGRRTIIAADIFSNPVGDIVCFIINDSGKEKDGWQVPPESIFKHTNQLETSLQ